MPALLPLLAPLLVPLLKYLIGLLPDSHQEQIAEAIKQRKIDAQNISKDTGINTPS